METIHLASMGLAVGATLLVVGAGALGGVTGRGQPMLDRALLVALVAATIALVTGVGVLATGARPGDPLHLVYAVVLVVLPLAARYIARPARSGRQSLVVAAGALVTLAVIVRLFQTG